MSAPNPATISAHDEPTAARQNKTFTAQDLAGYDGTDPSKPIYVAVKGTVFDVTKKAAMYGKGGNYNVFAGKDGSKGLGLSSTKPEDAIADYSTLNTDQVTVLNGWHNFFERNYNIVGTVQP